ncbi:MAG: heavy metal-responsive transcriptional regulator [Actinomycetota bacterium]|nr:heavy metal-responsive transcriptional regulator [Actinomycetota bacterium]
MRIGETAKAAGMTAKALRFYEDRGLLPAAERTSGGYRNYRQDTLRRLDFIRRARTAGLTLAQIQELLDLRDSGKPPCIHVRELLSCRLSDLDARITELTALRSIVAVLYQDVSAADPAGCDPDDICSYL